MRFNEIRDKSYPQSKRSIDKNVSFWLYYLIRPASFYPTYLAYHACLSANQATLIGFIFGIISLAMAYAGNMFYAALFLNVFAIIDCVDGNLARLGRTSKLGEYFDAVSGDIINYVFLPIFLLSALREGYLSNLEALSFVSITNIIILVALIQMLSALANQRFKIIFGQTEQSEKIKHGSLLGIIVRNGYGAAFLYPSSLIVSLFGCFDLLMIYMIISAPAYFILSVVRAIYYGGRKE